MGKELKKQKCPHCNELLLLQETEEGPKAAKQQSVLQEANELVNGDRAKAYGTAVESFGRIANIANGMMTKKEQEGMARMGEITDIQVCKILMALKISREMHAHKRDNLVDLAGYTFLLHELEEHHGGKR